MIRPDLHLHSNCSDGVLSPEMLAYEASQAGVTVMAITDHDTFAGSDSLRGRELPLELIPGVELSLCDMNGLHLLGYGLGDGAELRTEVERLAQKRVDRAREMLRRLAGLGMPIDAKALERKVHGTVGRPHIARALVHAGYVPNMQTAFEKYLGHDCPAYVAGERLNMASAIVLMRRSGFVPVLAHPCELGKDDVTLAALVAHWHSLGLMGMEVYHPSGARCYDRLDRMARRMGLLVTGGSDFHQENDCHGRIGCTAPLWTRAEEDVQALMAALRRAAE